MSDEWPGPSGHPSAYLFSFPFWIYTDSQRRPLPKKMRLGHLPLRIYPPFRSGPANFIPMPAIEPSAVPFTAEARVSRPPKRYFRNLAGIPLLSIDGGQAVLSMAGTWTDPPRCFPMDSLRVDVLESDPHSTDIREVVASLLSAVRIETRQWWIGRSVDVFEKHLRLVVSIRRSGAFAKVPEHYGAFRTVDGDELPLDAQSWKRALERLKRDDPVLFEEALLMDGRFHAASRDARRAILDYATAVEIAKEKAYERLWPVIGRGGSYRRGATPQSGYHVPRHLGRDLDSYAGVSYEREHPEHYLVIRDLWDARGDVAHGSPPQVVRNGQRVAVAAPDLRRFWQSSEHCVKWLGSVIPSMDGA